MNEFKELDSFDPKKIYKFDKQKRAFSIDIDLDLYKDIYNDWDFSPWRKRDLDDELHAYLLACVQEIPPNYKILIRFHLPEGVRDPEKEDRCRRGYYNYYLYCLYSLNLKRKRLFRNIVTYLVAGGIFLVGAVFFQSFATRQIFLFTLIPEGFFIGGWVLFWEAFSIIFFKDNDLKQDFRNHRGLLKAELQFLYSRNKNPGEQEKEGR